MSMVNMTCIREFIECLTSEILTPSSSFYEFSTKFYERVMSMNAKSSVDSVRYDMIADMVIMIPTNIAEQQKIASYFTNLDSQITLQTQRLEKLKQIKSACLDNMFV